MATFTETPTGGLRFKGSLFPSNFAGYVEVTLPLPASGSISNFTYILSLTNLPVAWKDLVGSNGQDIRVYDEIGTQLPRDVVRCVNSGDGDAVTGFILFRYFANITSSSKVRVYAGDPSLTEPDASSTYGQYNAYDSNVRGFWPYGLGNDRSSYVNHLTDGGSPSVGGTSGPIDGSLATDLNGTTQYGRTTVSVPASRPLTMFGSVNLDNVTVDHHILCMTNGTTSSYCRLLIINGPDTFRFNHNANFNRSASGTVALTTLNWHHGAGTEVGTFARYVYANGVNVGSNTATLTPGSHNNITVGAVDFASGTVSGFLNGRVAFIRLDTIARSDNYVKYWYDLLSDSDQSSFYGSTNFVGQLSGITFGGLASIETGIVSNDIYDEEGEGGIELNSIAIPTTVYNITSIGGLQYSSSALIDLDDSHFEVTTGGINVDGVASVKVIYTIQTNNGITLSGSALDDLNDSHFEVATGGIRLDGIAISSVSYYIVCLNGIECSGVALDAFINSGNNLVSGGIEYSGSALVRCLFNHTSIVNIVFSGSGGIASNNTYNEIGAGGVEVAGLASNNKVVSIIGNGGIQFNSSALSFLVFTPRGGITLRGNAVILHDTVSGGIHLSGVGKLKGSVRVTGFGGIVLGRQITATVTVVETEPIPEPEPIPSPGSGAVYNSRRIAPLIRAVTPLLSNMFGVELTPSDLTFNYPNRSVGYNSNEWLPTPNDKLTAYEKAAKKSQRLKDFASRNQITYFL